LMLEFRERNHASAERLAPIALPTLILQGEQDNLVAPEHAHAFKDAIPHSELLMFENVGHIPQEEVADDSAMAVQEFLYRVHEGPVLATAAAR
jgi:pimeloyl-ACP methyl ester carboxylesterase